MHKNTFLGKPFFKIVLLTISIFSSYTFADNPIVSQVFTADPAALVVYDKMYVITSHDIDGAKGYSTMTDYYLFSSDDMVNWQDHGKVFDVKTDSTWAKNAYAPDLIEKGGKFYLYYPDGGNAVGVAVADRPEGPYKDPLGRALVSKSTPGVNGVQWVFDPGVFIDDDGSAYLYFGGGGPGNLRVIQLNDDMISVNGSAKNIDAPYFFEAPYMKKRNGVYYLTYSTNGDNGSITIDYLTSDKPMTGFKHRGTVLANPWNNRGNNNHQSMVEWKGQWYMFYHNRGIADERGAGTFERSINVDLLTFDGDTLARVDDSKGGVPQIKNLNPFEKVEAETIDNESGIETARLKSGGMYAEFDKGDWVQISSADFNSGATIVKVSAATTSATQLKLFLDNTTETPFATISIPATGGLQNWQQISETISGVSGTHDLYLQANGRLNLDWYQFTAPKASSSSSSSSNYSSSSNSSSSNISSSSSSSKAESGGAISGFWLMIIASLFTLRYSLRRL